MNIDRTKFRIREGHCGQLDRQREILTGLAAGKSRILEIGLNAGHSTELFLDAAPGARVTSFDLFNKPYSQDIIHQLVDNYGNRFEFVEGNTLETLPAWFAANPGEPFDFVFIDGGHGYEAASSDLLTVLQFVPRDCVVAMDDIVRTVPHARGRGRRKGHTVGPSKVWEEAVEAFKVHELSQVDFSPGRGMAWGTPL